MASDMSAILSGRESLSRISNIDIVGSRWIYYLKRDSQSQLGLYKSRLVSQGFSQQPSLDYDETFSPVVKPATMRIVLSIDVSCHWPVNQLDVKNVFQHGDLAKVVNTKQPIGCVDSTLPNHVYRLLKAPHGIKQAPRVWYHQFVVYITSLWFISSKSNTSLFTFCCGIYLFLVC